MAAQPTMLERPPRKFEPRTIAFPEDVQNNIASWISKNIESLSKRLQNLHERKVPEWRRIVDGKPREENKSTPFPNCSNLVHQLAGEAVDDLAARVLQLIFETSPLVTFRYFTETNSTEEAERNSKQAKTLEKFIDYVAFEPDEVDLYTHENRWFTDSASLGKGWVCVAPEQRLEAVYIGYNEDARAAMFDDSVLYEGPKIINQRYEDILVDPDVDVFEDNDPIVRRCTLNKRKLAERSHKGHFLKEEVEKIIGKPDRYGAPAIKKRENQKKGITDTQDSTMAEWDIYECYFSWWHNNQKFRLICWFHQRTKTMLNCVYNFIPGNRVPIIETSLSITKKGFGEMLKDNQEEVSTAKNQRNDAISFGILGVNTIDSQNKTIDRNFTLWPGMFIPAKKGAFEHFQMAEAAMAGLSLQNEQGMIQQAKERAGVGPASSGMGTGTTNKKGQYSAMGTLSVMQDGNSRTNHRQSDFRHSHFKLLSVLVDFYGFLGLGRKAKLAGLSEQLLNAALRDHLSRDLRISMRAATASMNREVTKQNLIILNQAISAYIRETSSQLQAVLSPSVPPEMKQWMAKIVTGKTLYMQEIVRAFQISDQPQEYIPDIPNLLGQEQQSNGSPQPAPGAAGPVPIAKMAELIRQRFGGGSTDGGAGMVAPAGGPQGQGF